MKLLLPCTLLFLAWLPARAQFPPPAGQPGTTAIAADSSAFVAWATGCTVQRGPQDISNPGLGVASVGDGTMATGAAGTNGVVSLGDGGTAVLTFAEPITNGPGWDFAVFENGFNDTFLELAFVEVSSDGVDYVRFPATSNTQTDTQIDGFGAVDATLIDNLAGKYRAGFGTPFDLEQLAGSPGLDVNAVTHVKIIDVVGCIQDAYATHDHLGQKVNDPWSTPFASSGFDLDAVGVIHELSVGVAEAGPSIAFDLFPNPATGSTRLTFLANPVDAAAITITDAQGRVVRTWNISGARLLDLDLTGLAAGFHAVSITTHNTRITRKLLITDAQ